MNASSIDKLIMLKTSTLKSLIFISNSSCKTTNVSRSSRRIWWVVVQRRLDLSNNIWNALFTSSKSTNRRPRFRECSQLITKTWNFIMCRAGGERQGHVIILLSRKRRVIALEWDNYVSYTSLPNTTLHILYCYAKYCSLAWSLYLTNVPHHWKKYLSLRHCGSLHLKGNQYPSQSCQSPQSLIYPAWKFQCCGVNVTYRNILFQQSEWFSSKDQNVRDQEVFLGSVHFQNPEGAKECGHVTKHPWHVLYACTHQEPGTRRLSKASARTTPIILSMSVKHVHIKNQGTGDYQKLLQE